MTGPPFPAVQGGPPFPPLGMARGEDAIARANQDRRKRASTFDEIIEEVAAKYGLPTPVLKALIEQESDFKPAARRFEPELNEASYGLTQILESTARGMGFTGPAEQLFDPRVGIDLGARYLSQQLERTGGDVDAALSAYNGGYRPGYGIRREDGTFNNQDYVDSVNRRREFFEEELQAPPFPTTEPPRERPFSERRTAMGGFARFPTNTAEERRTEELTLEKKQPGESRREYLERTKPMREAVEEAISYRPATIGPAPTGWEAFKQKLGSIGISGTPEITVNTPNVIRQGIGGFMRFAEQMQHTAVTGGPGAALEQFANLGGQFTQAIVDPFVSYPAALLYDELGDNTYLLPEERSAYTRHALAAYGGLVTSLGTRALLTSARTLATFGPKAAYNLVTKQAIPTLTMGITDREMIQLAASVPGGWRARAMLGAAEGVTGGIVTGLIDAEPGERLDAAASYALMGMALGTGIELLLSPFAKGPALADERLAKAASEVFALRQWRVAQSTTPDEVASAVYNMKTTGDIGRALARTSMDLEKPIILDGLTQQEAELIRSDLIKHAGETRLGTQRVAMGAVTQENVGNSVAMHQFEDGTWSVAYIPDVLAQRVKEVTREVPIKAEGARMLYDIPHPKDPDALVELAVDIRVTPDRTAHIEWVGRPENAEPGALQRIPVGTKTMRMIQADILNRFPGIRRFKFERVSGIRRKIEQERLRELEHIAANIDEYDAGLAAIMRGKETQEIPAHRLNLQYETVMEGIQNPPLAREVFARTGYLPEERVIIGETLNGTVVGPGRGRYPEVLVQLDNQPEHSFYYTTPQIERAWMSGGIPREEIADDLYNAFRDYATDYFTEDGLIRNDVIPQRTIADAVRGFADERNIDPREIVPLARFVDERLARSALTESLSPNEQAAFRSLEAELFNILQGEPADIVDLVTSHGMYLERDGGSAILLRDTDTGSRVGSFNSLEAVRKFLHISGAADGPVFDAGFGGVPPGGFRNVVGGPPPPPNGPWMERYVPKLDSFLRRTSHAFNITTAGRFVSGPRQVAIALDSRLSRVLGRPIELFARVYDPVQEGARRMYAHARHSFEKLADVSELTRKLTTEELHHITNLMDLQVIDDIPVKPQETELAMAFNDLGVDVGKARVYQQAARRLRARFQGVPQSSETFQSALGELRAALNVDENVDIAVQLLDEIPDDLSIHNISRLSRRIKDGMNAEEYIKTNNLNPKIQKISNDLKSLLDDVSREVGIPREELVNDLFPLYRELGTPQDGTPNFITSLLQSGETSIYQGDPISNVASFIRGAYYRKYLKPQWEAAIKYLDEVTPLMPDGDLLNRYFKNWYLNEIRGLPREGSLISGSSFGELATDFFNHWAKKLKIRVGDDALRDAVNTFLNASSASALGARPVQGLRDVENFFANYYARYGTRRWANMVRIMSKVDPDELVEAGIITRIERGESLPAAMQREGATPGMAPISALTPEQMMALGSRYTSDIRAFFQKQADRGIKWGLQHNAYQWAHAAAYLENYKEALDVLNRLQKGGFGEGIGAKNKAYKKLLIDTYDLPVIQEFDRLVQDGAFEKAAQFLGRAGSFETVPTFGLANHPAGWGTNTGRLLGQFGSYSVWQRVQLSRLLTRGTMQQRARASARFAMSQGATKLTSLALGLNLSSWYLLPGALGFRGGPLASSIGSMSALLSGGDMEEYQAVAELSRLWRLGIPFSYAAQDVYEASEMASRGGNPISVAARAIGIRSSRGPSPLNPYGLQP